MENIGIRLTKKYLICCREQKGGGQHSEGEVALLQKYMIMGQRMEACAVRCQLIQKGKDGKEGVNLWLFGQNR